MNYVIINADTLQKRIDELEKSDNANWEYDLGKIDAFKTVLLSATTLVPYIKKAYDAGFLQQDLNLSFT